MPILPASRRPQAEPPKPAPRMPVDRYGKALGKAERLTPPTFKQKMWRKLEDFLARTTGLGPGEVSEDEALADSVLGLSSPMAYGVIKPGFRAPQVERLLDIGIDPRITGQRRNIIQNAVGASPNVASHMDAIRPSDPQWPSHVAPSTGMFGPNAKTDWAPMQKYIADAKSGGIDPADVRPFLDVEFSDQIDAIDLPRIAGHEFDHAAQIIRNPYGFGPIANHQTPGHVLGPDVYGFTQIPRRSLFGSKYIEQLQTPWELRPEELAAEVAGWKRAVGNRTPSKGVPYNERLVWAINNLHSPWGRDQLVRALKLHPEQTLNPASVTSDAEQLIQGVRGRWDRFFNKGGQKYFDPAKMYGVSGFSGVPPMVGFKR